MASQKLRSKKPSPMAMLWEIRLKNFQQAKNDKKTVEQARRTRVPNLKEFGEWAGMELGELPKEQLEYWASPKGKEMFKHINNPAKFLLMIKEENETN